VETLVVGDRFIPASLVVAAIADRCGPAFGPVRTVGLSGSTADQHGLRQVMELRGPVAVPVPDAPVAAAAGARVLCLHVAPVGATPVGAAPSLGLVAVAVNAAEPGWR
jgi:D-3-phosphoglycerate dehydrogenase